MRKFGIFLSPGLSFWQIHNSISALPPQNSGENEISKHQATNFLFHGKYPSK